MYENETDPKEERSDLVTAWLTLFSGLLFLGIGAGGGIYAVKSGWFEAKLGGLGALALLLLAFLKGAHLVYETTIFIIKRKKKDPLE
ncbi:hypothetical protein QEH56_23950 [Pelagicoccus enzymogenes]|uniref:hypothetical protein n=1 Tax=Pelagicoccus enzymogenes TaxID=2773457 RepID=UPI0028105FB5|nr:hypothetical protein [Pelagicoccus enzymogenes]MDQ8201239.1 hypothetical protein [Pelagicoccus enzymogenes]